MNAVLDAVDFGLLLIDQEGTVHTANRWIRARSVAGEDLEGKPLASAFSAPIDPHLARAVQACLDRGNSSRLSQAFHPTPLPLFSPHAHTEQRLRQAVDVTGLQVPGTPDQRMCLIQVRDVTELVKREQLLRSQSRQLSAELLRLTAAQQEIERQSMRFREITRMAPVGLFETDREELVTYCNARTCELLGLEAAAALNHPWPELFATPANQWAKKQARWLAATTTGLRYCDEFSVTRPGATTRWLRVEALAIKQPDGLHQGHIFTLVDVTDFREDAQRNEYRANHDMLTGLVNREKFNEKLQHLLSAGFAVTGPVAVVFIDLNRFKLINDIYGHGAGDAVLKGVATRIRRAVAADDLVARLGGDEFAVLIQGVNDPLVMSRITRRIEKSIGLPINIGTCHLKASAALGWACSSADQTDRKALLEAADAAMYRHKRRGVLSEVPKTTPHVQGLATGPAAEPTASAPTQPVRFSLS